MRRTNTQAAGLPAGATAAIAAIAAIVALSGPAHAQSGCGGAMADFQAALRANTAEAVTAYLDEHAPCFEAPARARLEALGGAPEPEAPDVTEAPAAAEAPTAEPEVAAAPSAPPSSCETLADARSEAWDEPLPIRVTNRTDETLSVAWVDYDGVPQPAGSVAPGDTFAGQSYATHPFVFADGGGTCVEIIVPTADTPDRSIGG